MATVIKEEGRNNTGIWIAVVVIAILAIGAIALLMANGQDDVDINTSAPASVVTDMGSAAADGVSDAAEATQDAAGNAADAMGNAAEGAMDATQNAAENVTR